MENGDLVTFIEALINQKPEGLHEKHTVATRTAEPRHYLLEDKEKPKATCFAAPFIDF
jgi:hypothetical protein